MKIAPQDTRGPLDPPDWFVQRTEELSRLMSSTPESVAKGLWYDLLQRKLVAPQIIPGRVLGPIGWHRQTPTHSTNSTGPGGTSVQISQNG
jgi:hypothetical protein